MKTKIRYYKYMPWALIFLLTACFDDKGNYDYTDIRDVIIDIPAVTENDGIWSCDRYSDLQLKPNIQFDEGTTAEDYSFEWGLYPQSPETNEEGNYDPKKIIGTNQNLDYHVEEAPADYSLVLRVTHKATKAVTDFTFDLVVNTVKGWLVLDENASGEGDLQIIRDGEIIPGLIQAQNGIVRNYFSASNQGRKLYGGKYLVWRNMNNRYDHLFVYQEDGFVKMAGATYEVLPDDYSTMFFTAPSVSSPMFHYYQNPTYGNVEFLCNDNEVYTISWRMMGQQDKFSTPISVFGTPVKFNPFIAPIPAVAGNINQAVLYSDVQMVYGIPMSSAGQFITVNMVGNMGYPATAGGAFNPQKINEDASTQLRLAYMAQGRDGLTCAIFRDELNDNCPWLYVADFRDPATPLALNKYDLSALENIDEAKLFAFGTRGDVMFYATENEVFSYVFGGGTTSLLSVPGEEVVAMKLYTHSANEDFSGRILFVATYDGTEGRVYKIKFNELNGQLEGDIEKFEGFGRVIDMIIKE